MIIEFIQTIIAFIVVLGLLITLHEFGHFWVARRCNVKVLRFSIGFGRPIYKRYFGRDRTEFVLAAFPLGGYVKMLDEHVSEVAADDLERAFNRKPLLQRTLIVLAGPMFNFIFAALVYWLIFCIGIDGLKPVIGSVVTGSPAERAGFKADDQIISVDGHDTLIWSSVADHILKKAVDQQRIFFTVIDEQKRQRTLDIDLAAISVDELAKGSLLKIIGFIVARPLVPAVIDQVSRGGAAERAGLQKGDALVSVDKKPIASWDELVKTVRKNADVRLNIEVQRQHQLLDMALTPSAVSDKNGHNIGYIGASVLYQESLYSSFYAVESYSVHRAFIKGIEKMCAMSLLTLKMLGKMLVGSVSIDNLSGPISIAQYAGQSAQLGIIAFLSFLALISVSLGVLNMLPVPLLDGGHLAYYLFEFILGKPVPESLQLIGQQVGFVLLFSLIVLAVYNDIARLIS